MSEFNYIIEKMYGALDSVKPLTLKGRVVQASGTIIKAVVADVKIGELCILKTPFNSSQLIAEVVGFSENTALLTPIGDIAGVHQDTRVFPTGKVLQVPVGKTLLGRVLDGMGHPIDIKEKGPLQPEGYYPVQADPPSPLKRKIISNPLPLGLRVIDGVLTCGEGQRMGIFGAAGVGKSTLMAMLVKNAQTDVNVLALIGERGREVREFIQHDLGKEGLKRSIIVVSTSDKSSIERMKAAYTATAIAEYFRDQGKKVLLLMDSVTRFARAQREIGLAAGEPPTRRGFPPSVFATLPKLMERTGMSDKGSITALYTVLVEGDDMTEPVADETRSILDGHIILSNKLAAAGHFPAIDVLKSASRVMTAVVSKEHLNAALQLREILAKYEEVELLVKIGEYKKGSDPVYDKAIAKIKAANDFLKQRAEEKITFKQVVDVLTRLVSK